eukprot:8731350-Pyramimonas_sp.AAC.1
MVWLALGIFPDVDHNGVPFGPNHHPQRAELAGQPLAGGNFIGAFSELRGDWKFQAEALGLQN